MARDRDKNVMMGWMWNENVKSIQDVNVKFII